MGDELLPPLGETGIRALARAHAAGKEMIAAHCVDLDPEEIELLASLDVAVAHCPRSNGFLGCGIAPLADLLRAGVRVGIGTDSPASAPSFDMFEELRSVVAFSSRARAQLAGTRGGPCARAGDTRVGRGARNRRSDRLAPPRQARRYRYRGAG